MTSRTRPWLAPILLTAIDVAWGWLLTTYGRPWLFQLLARPEQEASAFYNNVLEPRLWIGYATVLACQLVWVNLIAPRPLSNQTLRLGWWLGCGLIIASSVALRIGLTLTEAPRCCCWGCRAVICCCSTGWPPG